MSASKSFIKNAVGILIVVAICFVAVTIYKKGNASINSSISDYDEIVSQFDNAKLKNYDNSTASGSQIVDLLKNLKEEESNNTFLSFIFFHFLCFRSFFVLNKPFFNRIIFYSIFFPNFSISF